MISAISNDMIHWNQRVFLEPVKEGLARVKRCFMGIKDTEIYPTRLTWSERTVDVLTGLILMFPLLNFVVWVPMTSFGNPERLSQATTRGPFVRWLAAEDAALKK
jgi:hypothetical protein